MKHGKMGFSTPSFLKKFLKGKTGCVPPGALGFFQRLPEPILILRFQGQRRKGIRRSVVNAVWWMLLGFIIAGPNLRNLHSQDSRPARVADKKQPTTSNKLRQPGPSAPSARISEPAKASASSRREIVLPDIYIAAPIDTIAALKQRLEQAEREIRQLQRERTRLQNTLEQIQKRSFKGVSPPVQRSTELLGRPSV
jgi:hypothetical protein